MLLSLNAHVHSGLLPTPHELECALSTLFALFFARQDTLLTHFATRNMQLLPCWEYTRIPYVANRHQRLSTLKELIIRPNVRAQHKYHGQNLG